MIRHNLRMVVAFGAAFVGVAWICLMVSYWLPGAAGHALQATAWAMGIPGLVVAAAGFVMESEIVTELENRQEKVQRAKPLRCTDCGTEILNAGGTTIGDRIEGELMAGPWGKDNG